MLFPPYGLSGGYMRFDPGNLALYVDRPSGEFLGMEPQASPTAPALGSDRQRVTNRLLHERDHLFRHLSTGYGLVRYALHSVLFRTFCEFAGSDQATGLMFEDGLVATTLRQGLRESPFASWSRAARLDIYQHPNTRAQLEYLGALEVIRAMDADDVAWTDPALSLVAIRLWPQYFPTAVLSRDEDFRADGFDPDTVLRPFTNPANPLVPVVDGKLFGATALMEFFGAMREFIATATFFPSLADGTDLVGRNEYLRVIRLFFREFYTDRDRQGFVGKYPLELEAAADLALWPPLSPRGLVRADRPIHWGDCHPGWRFLRACVYLRDTRKDWHYAFDDGFRTQDEVVPAVQDEIADALGWPRVGTLVEHWREYLDLAADPADLTALSLDPDGASGRIRMTRPLLAERAASAYSTYMRPRNRPVDKSIFFPGFVCSDGHVVLEGDVWTSSMNLPMNWWEYHLFTGCRYFAEGLKAQYHFDRRSAEISARLLPVVAQGLDFDGDVIRKRVESFISQTNVSRYGDYMSRLNLGKRLRS